MKRSDEPVEKTVRCEIYTRKSSDEGLDQDFNSLHAQRDSAESFIASQRSHGWMCRVSKSRVRCCVEID